MMIYIVGHQEKTEPHVWLDQGIRELGKTCHFIVQQMNEKR